MTVERHAVGLGSDALVTQEGTGTEARPSTSSLRKDEDLLAKHRARRHFEQAAVAWVLRAAALISILTTIGIVTVLVSQSVGFFQEEVCVLNEGEPIKPCEPGVNGSMQNVGVFDFLTGTNWSPLIKPYRDVGRSFGVLPLVTGTFLVAAVAGIVSLGLGIGAAIFLSEYAPENVRRVIKPILEVLAGIPTVVYGYFALLTVTPILRPFVDFVAPIVSGLFSFFGFDVQISLGTFSALSAGLVMGIMIMPMVTTLSEDAMISVPRSLRDAAYALGATRFEVATKVVVPAALSGIVSSFILAVSRAVGETMIVYLAAGGRPNLTFNPLESVQAMTAFIVNVALGDTPHGEIEYYTIFVVGLLLFLITLVMNIMGRWVVQRFRQQYE